MVADALQRRAISSIRFEYLGVCNSSSQVFLQSWRMSELSIEIYD